jgi:hypothetical protein
MSDTPQTPASTEIRFYQDPEWGDLSWRAYALPRVAGEAPIARGADFDEVHHAAKRALEASGADCARVHFTFDTRPTAWGADGAVVATVPLQEGGWLLPATGDKFPCLRFDSYAAAANKTHDPDGKLGRLYGPGAVFTKSGPFLLVHLDHPSLDTIVARSEGFDTSDFFFDDCPLCADAKENGGHIVYDGAKGADPVIACV